MSISLAQWVSSVQCRDSERHLVGCRCCAVGDTERKRQAQARGTVICRAIHPLVPKNLDAESVQPHGRTGGSTVHLSYVLTCLSQKPRFKPKEPGKSF